MGKAYIIKRILYAVLIFFVVITLNFFIPRIGVSDPASRYYPPQNYMSDAEYEELKIATREVYGFDKSTFEQFLIYMGLSKRNVRVYDGGDDLTGHIEYKRSGLLQLNFGSSLQSTYAYSPVGELIWQKVKHTLVLSVATMVISVILGMLYGAYAAYKRGRWPETALLSMSTITTALPSFLIALVLSKVIGWDLGIFPPVASPDLFAGAGIGAVIACAVLPIVSMSIGGVIGYAQTTRNSVIAVANEDFIITAKAKGLDNNTVLYKHILRNALLPLVTSIGMSIGGLIGGAIIIERIFNWDGMGTLFINANGANDYPLMMGCMTLLSGVAIIGNLLTDFVYGWLDPRVKIKRR
jgi:peptide/nickel transport system permease protein